VRFAALRAIMALDPPMPYPGASRVPEMIAHFARSTGGRDGVVAMPNATQATDVAGKLATAGLDGAAAYRGEAAARLAAELSDLEVILVDMDIQSPGVRDVLYALRATPMSGRTPIALFAGEGRLADAQQLASEHERVIAVPRPYSAAAVRAIVARLLELSARDAVPAEERAAQAAQAVTWIAELLARGRTFYALRRQVPTIEAALYQPSAALPAIDALGRFGTPASQRALVAYASQSVHPLDSRGRAAAAFRESVGTRGLLLTRDEVLAQYAMYNASASADAGTQQVLGAILDAIEQETRGQVSR
jgi:hypothetical protein